MRKMFIALVFTALVVGCAKEKDVRDEFTGSWSGQQTMVIPAFGIVDVGSTHVMQVNKGSGEDRLVMVANGDQVGATVNGKSYTYDKYTVNEYLQGGVMSMEVTGSGNISGGKLVESGSLVIYYMGAVYNGSWSATYVKL